MVCLLELADSFDTSHMPPILHSLDSPKEQNHTANGGFLGRRREADDGERVEEQGGGVV